MFLLYKRQSVFNRSHQVKRREMVRPSGFPIRKKISLEVSIELWQKDPCTQGCKWSPRHWYTWKREKHFKQQSVFPIAHIIRLRRQKELKKISLVQHGKQQDTKFFSLTPKINENSLVSYHKIPLLVKRTVNPISRYFMYKSLIYIMTLNSKVNKCFKECYD